MSTDIQVTELPDTSPDVLGFFEAIALAGLESKWLRVNYTLQRRFFGRVPFGRKAVKVQPNGEVWTYQTMGFGRDWDEQRYRFNQLLGKFIYASTGDVASI